MKNSTVKKLKRELRITGKAARKMAKRMRREAPNTLKFLTS